MKAPQKLDFNYTKYGQMSLEWMQIWCIRSILVEFSQIDLLLHSNYQTYFQYITKNH